MQLRGGPAGLAGPGRARAPASVSSRRPLLPVAARGQVGPASGADPAGPVRRDPAPSGAGGPVLWRVCCGRCPATRPRRAGSRRRPRRPRQRRGRGSRRRDRRPPRAPFWPLTPRSPHTHAQEPRAAAARAATGRGGADSGGEPSAAAGEPSAAPAGEPSAAPAGAAPLVSERVKARAAARRREQLTYQASAIAASLGVGALAVGSTYYRFALHSSDGSDLPWWAEAGGGLRPGGGGTGGAPRTSARAAGARAEGAAPSHPRHANPLPTPPGPR
jgi:hypothetical protein